MLFFRSFSSSAWHFRSELFKSLCQHFERSYLQNKMRSRHRARAELGASPPAKPLYRPRWHDLIWQGQIYICLPSQFSFIACPWTMFINWPKLYQFLWCRKISAFHFFDYRAMALVSAAGIQIIYTFFSSAANSSPASISINSIWKEL